MDSERRASTRLATNLGTTCRAPATPQSATVLDLSMTGCRLRIADTLPQGATVNIEMRPARQIQGQVVWSTGQSAGVRFNRPLPENSAILLGLITPPPVDEDPVEAHTGTGALSHWIRKVLGWRIPAAR